MSGTRNSGRKRIPTAMKRATGAKIRHDQRAEPVAPPGVPPRPAHLDHDPEAAAAWASMASRLLDQHVLTTAHGEVLALIAEAWAQYVRLQRAYADGGREPVIVNEWRTREGEKRKTVFENPLCRQIRDQARLLNSLLGEFGQTPASAPGVKTLEGASDPFESFLATGTTGPVPVPFRPKKSGQARAR